MTSVVIWCGDLHYSLSATWWRRAHLQTRDTNRTVQVGVNRKAKLTLCVCVCVYNICIDYILPVAEAWGPTSPSDVIELAHNFWLTSSGFCLVLLVPRISPGIWFIYIYIHIIPFTNCASMSLQRSRNVFSRESNASRLNASISSQSHRNSLLWVNPATFMYKVSCFLFIYSLEGATSCCVLLLRNPAGDLTLLLQCMHYAHSPLTQGSLSFYGGSVRASTHYLIQVCQFYTLTY